MLALYIRLVLVDDGYLQAEFTNSLLACYYLCAGQSGGGKVITNYYTNQRTNVANGRSLVIYPMVPKVLPGLSNIVDD